MNDTQLKSYIDINGSFLNPEILPEAAHSDSTLAKGLEDSMDIGMEALHDLDPGSSKLAFE